MNEPLKPDVRFLMGNEAVARGLIEAGCGVATAYPGTPSSEILQSLVQWKKELEHPIYVEWSVNEKVAFEVAYGASLAGSRAAVTMKMVGLNVASDPFLSAAYLGVRGGLVVIVADDPGPHSSQTEQDSRFFSWFAKAPVLDPGSPQEAREMTLRAFELSEKYSVPVMLRPCLRVCHARQNVTLGTPAPVVDVGAFERNRARWAAIPKQRLTLHGELNQKLAVMAETEPEARPRLISGSGTAGTAVITSGSVGSHVRDIVQSDGRLVDLDVYKIGMPFPLQKTELQSIADTHAKTLVLEETYPVIELQFSDRRQTMGRYSGHVPSEGELTPDLVERIIVTQSGLTSEPLEQPQIKPRRPSLCPGCPHRSSFFAVKQVFGDAIYASDIGCYTLGINMAAVDTCLCMGASVGMAQGLAGRGQSGKVVATIGDSTFFHAGIPALINAAHTGSRFVLVVLDNAITAMTGGQPTPASSVLVDGAPARPVSLEKIIAACGVDFLEVVDPRNQESALDALQRADKYTYEERRGVSALIMRAPCVQSVKPTREHLYAVGDECDRCMTCIRDLECPAISFDREAKRARIDQDMCAGCGTCAQVCPSHAILPGGAS